MSAQFLGVVDTDAATLTVLSFDGLEIDQMNTVPVPAGPVSVFPMSGSDIGPALFAVVSRDAGAITLFRVDDGSEVLSGEFLGGPSRVVIETTSLWPDDALDAALHWTGAIAMTDASRITIGMHGSARGGPSVNRILADFPTAEGPVSIAVVDTNDDGRRDFLTASPSSGLAVVVQQ
ncbi:MAG: hypothetical protein KUG77_24145 [Nannocystaceae bacterium]|nr:hypothetical protein [Nannocystaceae bacterium]